MTSIPVRRRLRPAMIASLVLATALAALGVLAAVDPVAGATRFGIPLGDPADAWLMRVYASRTLVLAAVVVVLVALDHRRALATILAAATTLPLVDAVLTSDAGVGVWGRHLATALVLAVLSLLVARSSREATDTGTGPGLRRTS